MAITLDAKLGQSTLKAVAHPMSNAQFSSNREDSVAHGLNSETGRISSEIENLLNQSPYRELRRMDVTATENEIELRGTVSSYYLKQVAQEIARKVAANKHIRNLLQVDN